MPNGEVSSDLGEFINSYELSRKEVCLIEDPSEILPNDEEENKKDEKCSTFETNNSEDTPAQGEL